MQKDPLMLQFQTLNLDFDILSLGNNMKSLKYILLFDYIPRLYACNLIFF